MYDPDLPPPFNAFGGQPRDVRDLPETLGRSRSEEADPDEGCRTVLITPYGERYPHPTQLREARVCGEYSEDGVVPELPGCAFGVSAPLQDGWTGGTH